jgi:glyoxylase-like metal-dependent hydrolase (beta-lactamase superfamily II)
MVVHQLIVGSMGVCCYIVGCEKTKEAAVIDPGGNEEAILSKLEEDGLALKYIIATHGHADHVCCNRVLKERTGAKIIMHTEDATFFERQEILDFFSVLGLEHSPTPDIQVHDGDTIEVGEEKFTVIHTPGHSPGGISLYNAPHLFTGDTLFAGGVGRTDFPGGDHHTLFESINSKLFVLPDETIVWPGHGYGGSSSTIGDEKVGNPYL